jgi:hypothetical protein
MRKIVERGQISILAFLFIVVLLFLAIVGIDVYQIYEMRSWAIEAAQQAASSAVVLGSNMGEGVRTTGSDASPCVGRITLNASTAQSTAQTIMNEYVATRSSQFITQPVVDVRVLTHGGTYTVFPNYPSRGYINNPAQNRIILGSTSTWSSTEPSVAVAGIVYVKTWLGSVIGINEIGVTFFSATAVRQPDNACPAS